MRCIPEVHGIGAQAEKVKPQATRVEGIPSVPGTKGVDGSVLTKGH